MKLADAFALGFSMRNYKGSIAMHGMTQIHEGHYVIQTVTGIQPGASKPDYTSHFIPIDADVDTRTMQLQLTVNYTEEIAFALLAAGVAPVCTENIRKVKVPK